MDIKDKAIAELTMPKLYKIIQTEVSKGIEHQEQIQAERRSPKFIKFWSESVDQSLLVPPKGSVSTTTILQEDRSR